MRGFTFLEVTIVVAIVLIVGGTTALFGMQFFLERQAMLTAQLVRTSLLRASMYALNGRAGTNWGVIQSGKNLIIFSGESFSVRQAELDEIVTLPRNISLSPFDEIMFQRPQGLTEENVIEIFGGLNVITLVVTKEGAVIQL